MSSSGQSFQRSLQGAAGALVVPVGKGGFYSDPYKTVQIMADLRVTMLITTRPTPCCSPRSLEQLGLRPGRATCGCGSSGSPARAVRRPTAAGWRSLAVPGIGLLWLDGVRFHRHRVRSSVRQPCFGGPLVSGGGRPRNRPSTASGGTGEVVCTVLQRKASPLDPLPHPGPGRSRRRAVLLRRPLSAAACSRADRGPSDGGRGEPSRQSHPT